MWNDNRSHVEARDLDKKPVLRAQSGNMVFPGFTAPKLEWVRRNEPEAFERIFKIVLPASYLTWFLAGEYVIDMSDASGTSWLDVGERGWSEDLLNAGNMRREQTPDVVEGTEQAGALRHQLAGAWSLSRSVIVTAGAGDNAATACGVGAIKNGDGFVLLGTSGVLLVARNRYCPAPETALHTFCHAVPDKWYQMGVMLSATNSLNWLSKISGKSPRQLTAALGLTLRPPGPEVFLPYLSGERTPHNDPGARASFSGISAATTLTSLTQGVLEGVAFGLRDSAAAMQLVGANFEKLHLVSGGANSVYWMKLIATVLGVQLMVPRTAEFGAALGAARLAMIATGRGSPESVVIPPLAVDRIDPEDRFADQFEAKYLKFRATYPALRSV